MKAEDQYTTWLSRIPDEVSVADISLPGTHDSGAYQCQTKLLTAGKSAWQTQAHNFTTQLKFGIRVFDIRLEMSENCRLKLFHGVIELGPTLQMYYTFRHFLAKHPKQFLVIILRQEGGSASKQKAGEIFRKQMEYEAVPIHFCCGIPKVKSIRGKIWVITTNVGLNTFWVNTNQPVLTKMNNYWLQNFWEGPEEQKEKAAKQLLEHDGKGKMLKINYMNQAFGSKTSSFFAKFSLYDLSQHYNNFVLKTMKEIKKDISLGIIMMDFPEEELVHQIVEHNKHLQG